MITTTITWYKILNKEIKENLVKKKTMTGVYLSTKISKTWKGIRTK